MEGLWIRKQCVLVRIWEICSDLGWWKYLFIYKIFLAGWWDSPRQKRQCLCPSERGILFGPEVHCLNGAMGAIKGEGEGKRGRGRWSEKKKNSSKSLLLFLLCYFTHRRRQKYWRTESSLWDETSMTAKKNWGNCQDGRTTCTVGSVLANNV